MITAGSVRGNCALPHCVHTSSAPAIRGSSGPPQRGQKRVAQCHSAMPIAWKTSGASAASSARYGSAARMPTHSPRSPGASAGSTSRANQVRPSRSPSSTRVPSYGASAGVTHATAPSTGRTRVPATISTRVSGSAQRAASQSSSTRFSPARSWALAARSRCGKLTGWEANAREHAHRRPPRRHRARRPAARRPHARPVDRRDVPRRRGLLHARCAACSASPAPGAARGSRCRARAWASRRWRSTSTSCSGSTTCSRSSGSARAAG